MPRLFKATVYGKTKVGRTTTTLTVRKKGSTPPGIHYYTARGRR